MILLGLTATRGGLLGAFALGVLLLVGGGVVIAVLSIITSR